MAWSPTNSTQENTFLVHGGNPLNNVYRYLTGQNLGLISSDLEPRITTPTHFYDEALRIKDSDGDADVIFDTTDLNLSTDAHQYVRFPTITNTESSRKIDTFSMNKTAATLEQKTIVLSDNHVKATSATGGDMVVFTDIGSGVIELRRLAKGSAGQIPAVNGTSDGITWVTPGSTIGSNVITDSMIASHTSTKITITNKAQLPSTGVYTDQNNSYGSGALQTFRSFNVRIANPAVSKYYRLVTQAIANDYDVTFPLLTANDQFTMDNHTTTLLSKTLNSKDNVLKNLGLYYFTIFAEGGTCYCRNNVTGVIESSNADPTVVIQYAIDQSVSSMFKGIFIKAGTYLLSQKLTGIDKRFFILGEGAILSGGNGTNGDTILKANYTDATGCLFDCHNTVYTRQRLQDIVLDCSGTVAKGLDAYWITERYPWLNRVSIINGTDTGIELQYVVYVTCRDVIINGFTNYGLHTLPYDSTNGRSINTMYWYGGRITNNGKNVFLEGGRDLGFNQTVLEAGATRNIHITVPGAKQIKFTECSLESHPSNTADPQVECSGSNIILDKCRFSSNNTTYTAILAKDVSKYVKMINCQFQANNPSTTANIIVESGATGFALINNMQDTNTPLTVTVTDPNSGSLYWGNSFIQDKVPSGIQMGGNKLWLKEVDANTLGLYASDGTTRRNLLTNAIHTSIIRSTGSSDKIDIGTTGQIGFAAQTLVNGVIGSTITGIVDSNISAHTSTKITITNKAQLNSSIVYSDTNPDLGDHYLEFGDIAAPSNPAAGKIRLFMDSSNGELSVRKSGGTTVSLETGGGGGGGATTLDGLDNVAIGALYRGQTLNYNGTNFINARPALFPSNNLYTTNGRRWGVFFTSGAGSSGANLGLFAGVSPTGTVGTSTLTYADGSRPLKFTPAASIGATSGWASTSGITFRGWNPRFKMRFRLNGTTLTDYRFYAGFNSTGAAFTTNDPLSGARGVLFAKNDAGNFVIINNNNTTSTSTTLQAADNNIHQIEIWADDANSQYWYCWDNGTPVAIPSNIPGQTNQQGFAWNIETTVATQPTYELFWCELESD